MTRYALAFLVLAAAAAGAWGSPFGAPKVTDTFREPTNPKAVSASADAARSPRQAGSSSGNEPASYHEVYPQQYGSVQEAVAALNDKANEKYRELTGDTMSDAKVVGAKGQAMNELSAYIVQDEDRQGNPVFTITDFEELPSSGGEMKKQLKNRPKQYYIYHTGEHTGDSLTTLSNSDYKNFTNDPNLVAVLAYDAAVGTTAGMGRDGYLFNITRDGKLIDMSGSQSAFCTQKERETQTAKFLADESGNGGGAACVPHSVDLSNFVVLANRQISYMKSLIAAGKPVTPDQASVYNSYAQETGAELRSVGLKLDAMPVTEETRKMAVQVEKEARLYCSTIDSLRNTMLANGIAIKSSGEAAAKTGDSELGKLIMESANAGDDIVTTSIKVCDFMEEASKRQGKQQ